MDSKQLFRENVTQVTVIVLVFTLMVVSSNSFTSSIVERQIAQGAEEMVLTTEAKVQAWLQEAHVSLVQDAISVVDRVEMGQTPQQIEDYFVSLYEAIHQDPAILSGFLDIYGRVNGEYIDGSGWQPPPGYDPRERPWYINALGNRGKVVITDPYVDAELDILVVTLSLTLEGDAGEDLGVIGIDVDLGKIAGYVTSMQYSRGGYGLLVSPDLTFLAHPNTSYIGRPLESLGGPYKELADEMRDKPETITEFTMRNSEGIVVIVFYRQMYNGWYIGIASPRSSYFQDVRTMSFALAFIGVIMMVVLSAFSIRINVARYRSDEENKAKSSFLARVSHEIRTPMNSILGMAEIILRKDISEEVYEYASVIKQAGNTLLSIINDILDFSKIESGRVAIESRKYHPASLINDVVNVIRIQVAEKPIDFFVNLDGSIPAEMLGDDVRIRQILINILNNAVKYTRQGYITLSVQMKRLGPDTLKLFFIVEDSGIGISAGDMKQLFKEFTRVDRETNRGIEGVGLGLTIANSFCRAMGGEITVESTYGKGSTFTATVVQRFEDALPLARVEDAGTKRVLVYERRPKHAATLLEAFWSIGIHPAMAGEPEDFMRGLEGTKYDYAFVSSTYAAECISHWNKVFSSTQLIIMIELGETSAYRDTGSVHMPIYSGVLANVLNDINTTALTHGDEWISFTAPAARVLIVDDMATNIRVAAELMAPYKMQIDTCLSGGEALKLVRENRYDILFMDHMMPEMDGISAVVGIRALGEDDPYYRDLPVVMLTANAVSGQKDLFLKSGLNDFLAKPIGVQKLDEILRTWLPEEKQIAASGSLRESGEDTEALSIPGVDTTLGLALAGGSAAAYRKILAVFCDDVGERLPRIKAEAVHADLSPYTITVHALKGAARSIGAAETGELAAELEEAGKAGNRLVIAEKTGAFLERLELLRSRISAALELRSLSPGYASLDLGPLSEALKAMDTESVNTLLLSYSALPLDSNVKTLISEIEQYVLLFEYDKAVERIDALKNE
ncbi:hypothetical protein AGMMS49942_11600 [Spirochaetia bacterium]|nr:hypothetical protein AGMMS49942_11600 [Spirochaetia bacterium]